MPQNSAILIHIGQNARKMERTIISRDDFIASGDVYFIEYHLTSLLILSSLLMMPPIGRYISLIIALVALLAIA